ncbi:hypothetical protein [Microcystis phage Mel-JY03]
MTPTTLAAALLRDVPHDYNENGERVMLETEVLAALSRALDPALTERAGEVVADLRDDAQWGTPICTEAADLITALLAQNAALRAERDAAREQARSNSFAGEGYVFMQQRAEAAEAEVEKLREAADWQEKQRRDAFARRHINAPEDPHVAALCERYGYGAVMDAASRLWARKDSVGAFYIGGCIGIKPDAALTTEADNG